MQEEAERHGLCEVCNGTQHKGSSIERVHLFDYYLSADAAEISPVKPGRSASGVIQHFIHSAGKAEVEITEFAYLVWAALQSNEEIGIVKSDLFRISWPTQYQDQGWTYLMNNERAQLTFSTDLMSALGDLLTQAVSDSAIRIRMERLAFVYGRI